MCFKKQFCFRSSSSSATFSFSSSFSTATVTMVVGCSEEKAIRGQFGHFSNYLVHVEEWEYRKQKPLDFVHKNS